MAEPDAFGFKWANSCADGVLQHDALALDAAPDRPPDMRAWLSAFEAVRVVTHRVAALDAGGRPGVDACDVHGLRASEDIAIREWAARRVHAPGRALQLRRALPTGAADVVTCRDGAWTVHREDAAGNRLTRDFPVEVPRAPPIAKQWCPAPSPLLVSSAGAAAGPGSGGAVQIDEMQIDGPPPTQEPHSALPLPPPPPLPPPQQPQRPRGPSANAAAAAALRAARWAPAAPRGAADDGPLAPTMRGFNRGLRRLLLDLAPAPHPRAELAHVAEAARRAGGGGAWDGWDLNEAQVADARARCRELSGGGFSARAFVADCFAPQFRADRAYDLAVCFFALQFALSSEAAARDALRGAARLLRPGGLFVGIAVNGEEVRRWRKAAGADGVAAALGAGGAPLVRVRFAAEFEPAWSARAGFGRGYWFNAAAGGAPLSAGGDLREFAADRDALVAAAAAEGLEPARDAAGVDVTRAWGAWDYAHAVRAAGGAGAADAARMIAAVEGAAERDANERLARFYSVFAFRKAGAAQ